MKANLSSILETWATLYDPIAHKPAKGSKLKAFYRIKTINEQNEFMRNQNTAKSPCMAYSVLVDAEASVGVPMCAQFRVAEILGSRMAHACLS